MESSTLIPEPYRSWLQHASEVPDAKERAEHIKEITEQIRSAFPGLYKEATQ